MTLTVVLIILLVAIAIVFWRYKTNAKNWQQELVDLLSEEEGESSNDGRVSREELLRIFGRKPENGVSNDIKTDGADFATENHNNNIVVNNACDSVSEYTDKSTAPLEKDTQVSHIQKEVANHKLDHIETTNNQTEILPVEQTTKQTKTTIAQHSKDKPRDDLGVRTIVQTPVANHAMMDNDLNNQTASSRSIEKSAPLVPVLWSKVKSSFIKLVAKAHNKGAEPEALDEVNTAQLDLFADNQDQTVTVMAEPMLADKKTEFVSAITNNVDFWDEGEAVSQGGNEKMISSPIYPIENKNDNIAIRNQDAMKKKNHSEVPNAQNLPQDFSEPVTKIKPPAPDLDVVQLNLAAIEPLPAVLLAEEKKEHENLQEVELNLAPIQRLDIQVNKPNLKEVKLNLAPIQRINTRINKAPLKDVELNLASIKQVDIPIETSQDKSNLETIVLDIKPAERKVAKSLETIDIPDYYKNRAIRQLPDEEVIVLPEATLRSNHTKMAAQLDEVIGSDDIRHNLMRQKISRRRPNQLEITNPNVNLETIESDEVLANLSKTDSPINRARQIPKPQRQLVRDSIIPSAARVESAHTIRLDADHAPLNSSDTALFTRFTPFTSGSVGESVLNTVSADTVDMEEPINLQATPVSLLQSTDIPVQAVASNIPVTSPLYGMFDGISHDMADFDSLDYADIPYETVYEPQDWQTVEKKTVEEPLKLSHTFPDNLPQHMDDFANDLLHVHSPKPIFDNIKTDKDWDAEFTQWANEKKAQVKHPLSEPSNPSNSNSAAQLMNGFLGSQQIFSAREMPAIAAAKPKVLASIDNGHIEPADKPDEANIILPMVSKGSTWTLPDLNLLLKKDDNLDCRPTDELLLENGITIEEKLSEFKVKVNVVDAYAGPVITRYEIEPDVGVRGSQVVNLEKDLARALGFASIRVVETIPGKTCMGLELPNPKRQMIRLSEIFNDEVFTTSKSKLTLALGQDISGQPVVTDLAKAPHLLVAGTTGSGKSVGVNAMILSMLFKASPEEVRLIMIDPKMLELSIYEGIPHLLAPVVTDMKLAANALNWCVNEMEKRYRLMSHVGVRNLAGYNEKVTEAKLQGRTLGNPFSLTPETPEPLENLPFIVVVVDEFADLMMTAGKKIEELIARLAQKARAAGIHLILATQRPSVDVITGLIKANIPTRIAFQVSSKIDSRTILDQMGAESLLGQGDMLFLPPGTGYPQRVHGAFVADDEVHQIVEYLKSQGEPQYVDDVLSHGMVDDDKESSGSRTSNEDDPLYDEAVALVIRTQKASISSVQRQLRIGYNRAARLVEQMEQSGVVSTPEHNGNRTVLVTNTVE